MRWSRSCCRILTSKSGILASTARLDSAAQAIKWRDAKIERITFELARLKAWRFGAKSERMSAEQRALFDETLAADQADLEAQLAALQGHGRHAARNGRPADKHSKRQPRRQPLPAHLPRVEHRIEPDNTTCDCGQAMQRVGEDVSERLDIMPAEFFVHGTSAASGPAAAARLLVQEPAAPQVVDNGLPTAGPGGPLVVSRFVDHLPYYRQEQINARSGCTRRVRRWPAGRAHRRAADAAVRGAQ